MADPLVIDESVPLDEVRAILTRAAAGSRPPCATSSPTCVVVGRCGAGLDNIDVAAAARAGDRRGPRARGAPPLPSPSTPCC